jgi:hypothetical protein
MRSMVIMRFVLVALLGVTTTRPAAAGDDGYASGHYGADVYVHSHAYYPPRRIRQVYPVGRPGPLNVHVVTYGGAPYVWYNARPPYFGPCYYWRCAAPYRRW